jgi:hypothetical protein
MEDSRLESMAEKKARLTIQNYSTEDYKNLFVASGLFFQA